MNQGILGYPGRVEFVQGMVGEVRNLVMKPNAAVPVTQLDVSWDDLVVGSLDGTSARRIGAGGLTGNFLFAGPNGMDGQALGSLNWYYVWVVWNGFAAALLFSTSNVTPFLASSGGWTHVALVGEVHYDGGLRINGLIYYMGAIRRFESNSSGLAALNTTVTFPHRLGRTPAWLQARLLCVTAEFGYVAGEELTIDSSTASQGSNPIASVYVDATNVTVVAASSMTVAATPAVPDKAAPGTLRLLTPANWGWKVVAST